MAATLGAQNLGSLRDLLPADGQVIEIADLTKTVGKPRVLVLWMLRPKKNVTSKDGYYCGTAVHGDFWKGPTRLSLIDPVKHGLINTIKIRFDEARRPPIDDEFWIPFSVGNSYYFVPRVTGDGNGKPEILHFRDFTGEGLAAQFPLFIYDACGLVTSSVFGYSLALDRAIQYPVLVTTKGEHPTEETWVQQVFAATPASPGQWKFIWQPGHGSDDTIDEEVSFDRAHQRFVERRNLVQPK